jgi:hypothetical protein
MTHMTTTYISVLYIYDFDPLIICQPLTALPSRCCRRREGGGKILGRGLERHKYLGSTPPPPMDDEDESQEGEERKKERKKEKRKEGGNGQRHEIILSCATPPRHLEIFGRIGNKLKRIYLGWVNSVHGYF